MGFEQFMSNWKAKPDPKPKYGDDESLINAEARKKFKGRIKDLAVTLVGSDKAVGYRTMYQKLLRWRKGECNLKNPLLTQVKEYIDGQSKR